MKKTYISEVNLANVNETVNLKGWVHAIRDFGGKTIVKSHSKSQSKNP